MLRKDTPHASKEPSAQGAQHRVARRTGGCSRPWAERVSVCGDHQPRDPGPLELANAELSKAAATEGMVLLENHNNALPIASGGNVAVFGVGSYRTVNKGGTGSVRSTTATRSTSSTA